MNAIGDASTLRRRTAAPQLASAAVFLMLGFAPWAAGAQGTPPAGQDPAAQAAEEQPAPEVSETITVTARKREEDLQEVPISVAAPSEELLRARGVDSLEGVSQNVAGFSVQNLGQGQSQVAMRGVSAGQIVRDQPGVKEQVGIYLDESVISLSLFTPEIDLFDISRVEVLRGPQGTLFGSGSLSGTVRYITNQPEIARTETVAEFSVTSISGGDIGGGAKVAVNVPLGETAAMRVTGYYNKIGGYIDRVEAGVGTEDDVNSSERTGVRLSFLIQPNEQLSITPRLMYQEVESDGRSQFDAYNILGNSFTTTRPQVDLDEREAVGQIADTFTDEFLLADLAIDYDFGAVGLTSVTSYTDRDILAVRDAGALTSSITGGSIGLPENIYTLDAPLDDATTVKVVTQELRLTGSRDSLVWVGGAFYSKIDRDYGQSLFVDGFEDLSGIPTAGTRGAGKDILFFSDLSYDFEQLAIFGEATWAVNESFNLTGGLRYYDFDEERTQVFDGIFADPASLPGSTQADGFAPRVIASYRISDATTFNAQVSQGFRLGGINDNLNLPLCTPQDLATYGGHPTWEDEKLWNYEIGTKSNVMGGRGTFNVSAFYMDIEDLQATLTAGSCSSRIILNVPKARSTGLEMELTAATSEHFDFSLSASYTNSELSSTFSSAGGNLGIVSGNRLPTVPELQAVAAATYQWQVSDEWLGYFTGSYQHVGSRFTQIGDQAAGFGTVNLLSFGPVGIGGPFTQNTFTFDAELPAYDLFNLRFGLVGSRWDLALFGNNLTDERALLALDQERGTRARVGFLTNQPRTFGVTARVRF